MPKGCEDRPGRQRRSSPPPPGEEEDPDALLRSLRTHAEYDEMMSKMTSPRGGGGGGHRRRLGCGGDGGGDDDDDRSRSSWSLSHMLDFVQLRGGCRQRGRARFQAPGAATTWKRRSWPSSTRRPLLSGSESESDGEEDGSTKIAELKSRLRSMRRERKDRIFREETRQDEGCDGRRGDDDDEDRSKSSWSISNLLDFVQLQGGCRQESLTGGGADLCAGRESGDDGSSTFRGMTTKVAELKSQLRSIRSEQRRGRIPRVRTGQEDGFALSLSRGTSSEDRVGGEADIPGDSGFDIAIALAKKTLEWDTAQRRQGAESNQYAVSATTAHFETPSSPLTASAASRPATSESTRNNFIDPSGKTGVSVNKFTDPPEFIDPPGATSDVTMMGNSYGMNNGASGNAAGSGGTMGMHQIPTHTMSSGPAPYCQMMPQQQTPFPNIYEQQTHRQQMSQQQLTPQKEMTHQQLHQRIPQYQQPQQSKSQPQYQQPTTQQNGSQAASDIGLGNRYNASTLFGVGASSDVGTGAHPWMPNASPYNPSQVSSRPSPSGPSPSSMPSLSRPSFSGRSYDDEFQHSNKILNELRIKNELIQQDIERMKKDETGGAPPVCGGGSPAVGTGVGPNRPVQSGVQSRQPSTAKPALSPRERMVQTMQRSGNVPKQEKAHGGEEEVLMSHADTLKYLFKIR